MIPKKIAIACDHRGVELKNQIIEELTKKGYQVKDFGSASAESCDYPDFVLPAAEAVSKGEFDRGIAICDSGTGMCIAANKVKGIRAAIGVSLPIAEMARKHNDTNMLCIAAGYVSQDLAKQITHKWLETEFEGGRHERRVAKIIQYEKEHCAK